MAAKIPQVVGNLPSPPNPADRSTFNTLAYPWSEALTPWTNEMNQLAADTYDNALDVQGASTVTGSDRDIALGAASAASVDAGLANGYKNEAFASKQSASASAGLADASRSDAQTAALAAATWATSTTVVSGGNKGAKGYALDAAQSAADAASIVLGEVFDNTQESAVKGWTSSKIVAWFNGLTTTFTRTLLTRTNAAQARSDLGLGYAATAPTVGDGVDVMRVGAGGWMGQGATSATTLGYPPSIADVTNQTKVIRSDADDSGVAAYSSGIHFSSLDTWGRLRVSYLEPKAWVQGGQANSGTGWTAELYHSGNLFADASGVMTSGSGQLSSDMSDFLASDTFDEMAQKVGGGSAPKPTKNHGNVAVTGSQTVTCDVQESDFHIMSMGTSDAAGTLTIDFSNMPDTLGKHFSWHVRLRRGARKTVAFAQTVNWAGGVAPTFGGDVNSQDLMLFYKVDSETIRGMVIDAW